MTKGYERPELNGGDAQERAATDAQTSAPLGKTARMLAAMEPDAEAALSPEHGALVSIAISLKRIADEVAGNGANQSIAVSLFYASQALERRL